MLTNEMKRQIVKWRIDVTSHKDIIEGIREISDAYDDGSVTADEIYAFLEQMEGCCIHHLVDGE